MQNFMVSYVNIVLSLYLLNCFRWVNMLYVELSMMNETRVMVLIIQSWFYGDLLLAFCNVIMLKPCFLF